MAQTADSKKETQKMKSIQFQVTEDEHKALTTLAQRYHIPLKEFIRYTAIYHTVNFSHEKRMIMQQMPLYYNLIRDVKHPETYQQLLKIGGIICQNLK